MLKELSSGFLPLDLKIRTYRDTIYLTRWIRQTIVKHLSAVRSRSIAHFLQMAFIVEQEENTNEQKFVLVPLNPNDYSNVLSTLLSIADHTNNGLSSITEFIIWWSQFEKLFVSSNRFLRIGRISGFRVTQEINPSCCCIYTCPLRSETLQSLNRLDCLGSCWWRVSRM